MNQDNLLERIKQYRQSLLIHRVERLIKWKIVTIKGMKKVGQNWWEKWVNFQREFSVKRCGGTPNRSRAAGHDVPSLYNSVL